MSNFISNNDRGQIAAVFGRMSSDNGTARERAYNAVNSLYRIRSCKDYIEHRVRKVHESSGRVAKYHLEHEEVGKLLYIWFSAYLRSLNLVEVHDPTAEFRKGVNWAAAKEMSEKATSAENSIEENALEQGYLGLTISSEATGDLHIRYVRTGAPMVKLEPQKLAIFRCIYNAAEDGISSDILSEMIFGDCSRSYRRKITVQLSKIRKVIAAYGFTIITKKNPTRYFLRSTQMGDKITRFIESKSLTLGCFWMTVSDAL